MISEQESREIHAALCANGLNNEVANYLVALAERISLLEDKIKAYEIQEGA